MKKVNYIVISIILIIGVLLSINYTSKNKYNKNNIDNKSLAIYLKQDDGSYTKTTSFPNKGSGYVLNSEKSVCNGNANISWDNEEWGLELDNIDREETKCYLYFDKGKTISDIITTLNAKEETPDFSVAATTDEGVFKTEDGMYGGTSYYWRGAVENNYVKFANYCWRIIRINGDGSIRLIYDGSTCHANGTNTTDSIAVAGQTYNANRDRSEYVGYTFTEGSQRGIAIDSNLKIQNEIWYTNNLASYADKIADGKYCNDRNTASGYSWSSQATSTFYYAGYDRSGEKSTTSIAPTLSCNNINDIYILKIGAITVDEVLMAGSGKYGISNSNYYLYNGQNYWTMSPYYWYYRTLSDCISNIFYVYNDGQLAGGGVNAKIGLRPVINLKSRVTFNTDGDGSLSNPYEVQ